MPEKPDLTFSYMEEVRATLKNFPYGATWGQIEAITCLPSAALNKILGTMEDKGEVIKWTEEGTGKTLYKLGEAQS